MSEFRDAVEQFRLATLRLRPIVRPYIIGGLIVVLVLAAVWDVKRYLDGNPRDFLDAAANYAIGLGVLLFDFLMERKLKSERRESTGHEEED